MTDLVYISTPLVQNFSVKSSAPDNEYQTPQSKKRLRMSTSTPGSEVKQQSNIPQLSIAKTLKKIKLNPSCLIYPN
jgi:hypothetical protein